MRRNTGKLATSAFGARPNHPLLIDALDEAANRTLAAVGAPGDADVLRTTGPYMLSEVYHAGRRAGRYADVVLLEATQSRVWAVRRGVARTGTNSEASPSISSRTRGSQTRGVASTPTRRRRRRDVRRRRGLGRPGLVLVRCIGRPGLVLERHKLRDSGPGPAAATATAAATAPANPTGARAGSLGCDAGRRRTVSYGGIPNDSVLSGSRRRPTATAAATAPANPTGARARRPWSAAGRRRRSRTRTGLGRPGLERQRTMPRAIRARPVRDKLGGRPGLVLVRCIGRSGLVLYGQTTPVSTCSAEATTFDICLQVYGSALDSSYNSSSYSYNSSYDAPTTCDEAQQHPFLSSIAPLRPQSARRNTGRTSNATSSTCCSGRVFTGATSIAGMQQSPRTATGEVASVRAPPTWTNGLATRPTSTTAGPSAKLRMAPTSSPSI